jgi:hypothetical protein
MVHSAVKRKLRLSYKSISVGLIVFAVLTFILSLLGAFPAGLVERVFSRRVFPTISVLFGSLADSVGFAWLDLLITAALLYIGVCVRRRRWLAIGAGVAVTYLVFFWSWGINYHRVPLTTKLSVQSAATSDPAMQEFARQAAAEINQLYAEAHSKPYQDSVVRAEASARISRVVEVLDGTTWSGAKRVKVSLLANPWFRVAGIDGLFNPIIHEPIVNSRILEIERPFIMSHELAHVHGYPDEGDANLVAVLATVLSRDPQMRYSGWLHLWLYVRDRKLDALLESGPKQDIQRIFDRLLQERVAWVANVQSAVLDWFLRANSVSEGVRSYSRVAILAAGTQEIWDRFR